MRHRCLHCATPLAGERPRCSHDHRERPPWTHPDFCNCCAQEIYEALQKVPRRFVRVMLPAPEEVTVALLDEWDAALEEKKKARGGLVIRRVGVNLFDLVDPTNKNRVKYVSGPGDHPVYAEQQFYYSTWTKRGETTITRAMQKDLSTGEITGPWYETGYAPSRTLRIDTRPLGQGALPTIRGSSDEGST